MAQGASLMAQAIPGAVPETVPIRRLPDTPIETFGGWKAVRPAQLQLLPENQSQATLAFELVFQVNDGAIPEAVLAACQSVGKVSLSSGNVQSHGSGTYLGDGIWLTNRHVVADGGTVSVAIKTGEMLKGRVVSVASTVDCAIIETADVDQIVRPVPIADSQPKIGDTVYPSGFDFGDMSKHCVWPAKVVSFFNDGHINSIGTTARRGSISGNSGGPTLTADGELISPLWGNAGSDPGAARDGTGTTMTCCWIRTRTFLLPWRERVVRSLARCGSGGCQGGQCPPQRPSGQWQQPIQPIAQPPVSQPTVPSFKPTQPTPAPSLSQAPIKGDKGDRGEKGDPGQVTKDDLKAIADEVIRAIASDPAFRGPPGLAGPAGREAVVDYGLLAAEVAKRIPQRQMDYDSISREVISRLPELRVVLVDGKNKVVLDDETYKPGEALVLDINKLIRERSTGADKGLAVQK
jgi:hypothetical protein